MTVSEIQPTYAATTISGPPAVRIAVGLGFAAVGAGVIARRKPMMGLLERLQADEWALRTIRELRQKYGRGPVELALPGRRLAVVLDERDVARVLEQSPDPFTPANKEKRGALSPFQPRGVLISQGPIREERRQVNEQALDTDQPLHHLAESFVAVVDEEFGSLISERSTEGTLDASSFTSTWWRVVRRVTLGDSARDDEALTDALWTLRSHGNWTYLHPTRRKLRDSFLDSLYEYAQRDQPGSLVNALNNVPTRASTDPVGQVPHWLFAFDAAGIACTRALALLSTHPALLRRALDEVADANTAAPQTYPFLRSCILEAVRLWPTTPAILRDSTQPTVWGTADNSHTIAAGTAFLILATAFHRDPDILDSAHAFDPDIWLDGRAQNIAGLVPFSAGPAICPGRNLVLHLTSTVLAVMLSRADFTLTSDPKPSPEGPLPMTLNNFGLSWSVRPAGARW